MVTLEMFKLERKKVTKDALYQSAIRLWEVHREMEYFRVTCITAWINRKS